MHRSIAITLGLTFGCFVATASAEQCGDVLQQDKSQQNSADEAQVRGDLKAGSLTVAAGSRMRGQVEFGWEDKSAQKPVVRMDGISAAMTSASRMCYAFSRDNGYAVKAREPSRRIDYIFVRGPDRQFRGEPMHTEVAFNAVDHSGSEPVWPSDHFGVYTDLEMSKRSF